ncbi:MAG TPA: cupin domain-containing protein, partial [Casimicrobiaceae bacterium]|nr:cupin domain-containing protein [Casimicrobiaceae bacterium]
MSVAILARMDLLGGRSVAAFLREQWHAQALLVTAAMPRFEGPVTRERLFALAGRDDVASRIVQRARGRYALYEGPFSRARLRAMPARDWTLLVQGVNLHDEAADRLLRRFAFIPYARLDDLMASYAAPGGGVGPHYDSYDVFLLQAYGRRRWRYGRQRDLALRPDAPVKLLARFSPEHEATLAPGDMLYLPPDYAHDGVAVDECVTYSIGFRAPTYQALAEAFLDHLRDTVHVDGRYADRHLRPTKRPARIDATMQRKVARALAAIRWDADDVARFLGRHLTEPKPDVVFTPRPAPSRARFAQRIGRAGVRLDPRVHLLYDAVRYYLNGDDAPLPTVDREALQSLAD